jgi:hypothetical protein
LFKTIISSEVSGLGGGFCFNMPLVFFKVLKELNNWFANGCFLCGCFSWLQWLFEVRKAALTQIQVVFILRHLEK